MEERDDELIARIAHTLREQPMRRLGPSFDAKVMAAIRWESRPHTPTGVRGWLLRPRQLSISPLAGLAAAAAFAGVAYFGAATAVRQGSEPAPLVAQATGQATAQAAPEAAFAAADNEPLQRVQFVLLAPAARSVSLAGDFNDWDTAATPLVQSTGNVWTVEVPLTPGRYSYTFVVDGSRWVPDPAAPRAVADDFGGQSSVITVGGSSS